MAPGLEEVVTVFRLARRIIGFTLWKQPHPRSLRRPAAHPTQPRAGVPFWSRQLILNPVSEPICQYSSLRTSQIRIGFSVSRTRFKRIDKTNVFRRSTAGWDDVQ